MKATAIVILVLISALVLVMMVLFLVTHWIPSRYSISDEQFSEFGDYILVKEVFYTGTGWTQVGDNNGYYQINEIKEIALTGKKLPFSNMGRRVNTFLCIVEYEGEIDHAAFTEPIDSYSVIEWHPVYPVVRDSIWPDWMLPSRFMTEKETKYY